MTSSFYDSDLPPSSPIAPSSDYDYPSSARLYAYSSSSSPPPASPISQSRYPGDHASIAVHQPSSSPWGPNDSFLPAFRDFGHESSRGPKLKPIISATRRTSSFALPSLRATLNMDMNDLPPMSSSPTRMSPTNSAWDSDNNHDPDFAPTSAFMPDTIDIDEEDIFPISTRSLYFAESSERYAPLPPRPPMTPYKKRVRTRQQRHSISTSSPTKSGLQALLSPSRVASEPAADSESIHSIPNRENRHSELLSTPEDSPPLATPSTDHSPSPTCLQLEIQDTSSDFICGSKPPAPLGDASDSGSNPVPAREASSMSSIQTEDCYSDSPKNITDLLPEDKRDATIFITEPNCVPDFDDPMDRLSADITPAIQNNPGPIFSQITAESPLPVVVSPLPVSTRHSPADNRIAEPNSSVHDEASLEPSPVGEEVPSCEMRPTPPPNDPRSSPHPALSSPEPELVGNTNVVGRKRKYHARPKIVKKRKVIQSDDEDMDEEPLVRKPKRKSKALVVESDSEDDSASSTASESDESGDGMDCDPLPMALPPPPAMTSDQAEVMGMLIEALAATRATSLTVKAIWRDMSRARPGLKQQRTDRDWFHLLISILELGSSPSFHPRPPIPEVSSSKIHSKKKKKKDSTVDIGGGVFGKVEKSRKRDIAFPEGKGEPQWFYIPENDPDRERGELLQALMPHPAKRAATKTLKHYYFKPLEKLKTSWEEEG